MKIIIAILLISLYSCTGSSVKEKSVKKNKPPVEKITPIIDIRTVINKSPDEIKEKFGKPSKVIKNVKDCGLVTYKCDQELQFNNGKVIVQFANKKAVYFEFNFLYEHKFNDDMYQLFGLEKTEPTYSMNKDVCRFDRYYELSSISFIEYKVVRGFIDYAIVKVVK
jgi:hypothetical protein